jgi:hypothetical protein
MCGTSTSASGSHAMIRWTWVGISLVLVIARKLCEPQHMHYSGQNWLPESATEGALYGRLTICTYCTHSFAVPQPAVHREAVRQGLVEGNYGCCARQLGKCASLAGFLSRCNISMNSARAHEQNLLWCPTSLMRSNCRKMMSERISVSPI